MNKLAPNCFHVALIHLDPIGSDYVPQESDLNNKESALPEIPMQLLYF